MLLRSGILLRMPSTKALGRKVKAINSQYYCKSRRELNIGLIIYFKRIYHQTKNHFNYIFIIILMNNWIWIHVVNKNILLSTNFFVKLNLQSLEHYRCFYFWLRIHIYRHLINEIYQLPHLSISPIYPQPPLRAYISLQKYEYTLFSSYLHNSFYIWFYDIYTWYLLLFSLGNMLWLRNAVCSVMGRAV